MIQAAGTLLYRLGGDGLEVLLVHPAGAYNRRSPWGIPKGVVDGDESLEQTARRETREETGVVVDGPLVPLGHIDYARSRKRVFCFAGPAPTDAAPHCASWEVDQACFLPLPQARAIIHPAQAAFLDRLEAHLADPERPDPTRTD